MDTRTHSPCTRAAENPNHLADHTRSPPQGTQERSSCEGRQTIKDEIAQARASVVRLQPPCQEAPVRLQLHFAVATASSFLTWRAASPEIVRPPRCGAPTRTADMARPCRHSAPTRFPSSARRAHPDANLCSRMRMSSCAHRTRPLPAKARARGHPLSDILICTFHPPTVGPAVHTIHSPAA